MAKGKTKKKRNKDKLLAQLKPISPGVLVNKNYKPGRDPAMDAVIEKLKKDPNSLNTSGTGQRWKI